MRRAAGGRRERSGERARSSRWSILLIAALIGASLVSIGVVFAHWAGQASLAMETTTGTVASDATGDPTFGFPGCTAGTESETCDKFDNEVIGTTPLSYSAGGATFEITGWVHKAGEPDQQVGFYYTITGGSVDIRVKAGQNYLEHTLNPGSGFWLNPACTGDPGPGGSVTCSPANTRAISHIDFCIKISTPPDCPPPQTQDITLTNTGSVPFDLRVLLANPEFTPPGTDYCDPEVFALSIHELDGSGFPVDPPRYSGPLCDLFTTPLSLSNQVDPGESVSFQLNLMLTGAAGPFLNETSGALDAVFTATQWNEPGGWTAVVEEPVLIHIGTSPVPLAASGLLEAPLDNETLSVERLSLVGASVPATFEVGDSSVVTITEWLTKTGYPDKIVGFLFTVTGDPVYVTVSRSGGLWTDERWEAENPHIWHDPFGLDSTVAEAITGISFALVPLTEEPPAGEGPSAAEPPAEEPPAEEPPADEPPAEEPPVEEPPAEEPPAEEPPADEPPAEEPASLSGIVWLDEDGDGIRNAEETGVGGVTVRLLVDNIQVAATVTAADGSYSLSDLTVGTYTVEILLPEAYIFTVTGQGDDPTSDSDVAHIDQARGQVVVPLAAGDNAGLADAGILPAEAGGE